MEEWPYCLFILFSRDQLSFVQPLVAVRNQLVARLETASDLDFITIGLAYRDRLLMGNEPVILLDAYQYIFTRFIGLKRIDRDGDHIGSAVVLELCDRDLVGADIATVWNMDLHLEGAVIGIDDFRGDSDGTCDLFVIQAWESDPDRCAYPDPFLVDLGDEDDDLEIVGIDNLKRLASLTEGLAYLNIEDIDGTGDIGVNTGEIELLLVDLQPGLRLVHLVLCVDQVH